MVGFPSGQAKSLITPAALQACQSLGAQLPGVNQSHAPSQAQLQQMIAFSHCMRAHGLSSWPDPGSDGLFPLPQDIIQRGKGGIQTQLHACHNLYDGPIGIAPAAGSGGQ
jgi:hypothetical protein